MKKTAKIPKNKNIQESFEDYGDNHTMSTLETLVSDKSLNISDEEKISVIERHFKEIMTTLGLDLSDDSLKGTPHRVAKMYVKEAFVGLKNDEKPKISLFDNKYEYGKMLVEKNISFYSCCEHHFLPIYGKVHIAYISSGKVIGLSKLHRIVNYFSRRPQVQERLTVQIFNELRKVLQTDDVAIFMDAFHMCVSSRGIEDVTSSTVTVEAGGAFEQSDKWNQFATIVNDLE